MSQPESLTELNDENIVQFQPRNKSSLTPQMMKFARFREAIEPAFGELVSGEVTKMLGNQNVRTYAVYEDYKRGVFSQCWFREGVDCEMLKLGDTQWRRGKIRMRVSLEFVPDKPSQESEDSDESPLAEIRQEIAANSLDT